MFTAPALVRDAELTALFGDGPAAPDNRVNDLSGTLVDHQGNPISGPTLEIGGKAGATGSDGSFSLKDVPSGTHTVVATDGDGRIVGHGQMILAKGEDASLSLTVDADGNPVIRPGQNTNSISLAFVLEADGRITLRSAQDITPAGSGPKTGDDRSLGLWAVLFLACAGALAGLGCRKWMDQKKKAL